MNCPVTHFRYTGDDIIDIKALFRWWGDCVTNVVLAYKTCGYRVYDVILSEGPPYYIVLGAIQPHLIKKDWYSLVDPAKAALYCLLGASNISELVSHAAWDKKNGALLDEHQPPKTYKPR